MSLTGTNIGAIINASFLFVIAAGSSAISLIVQIYNIYQADKFKSENSEEGELKEAPSLFKTFLNIFGLIKNQVVGYITYLDPKEPKHAEFFNTRLAVTFALTSLVMLCIISMYELLDQIGICLTIVLYMFIGVIFWPVIGYFGMMLFKKKTQ